MGDAAVGKVCGVRHGSGICSFRGARPLRDIGPLNHRHVGVGSGRIESGFSQTQGGGTGMRAFVLITLAVSSMYGQSAQITGFVKDPSGAAVAKANLIVTNQDTRVDRKTTTNDAGLYSIPALQP